MTDEQIDEWINRTSEWTEQVGTAVPVDVVRQIVAAVSAEQDRDAARYRWLRTQQAQRADDYDKAVDDAIAKYEQQIAC
ncbi:hypothetical protein [Caballeronia sp. AZ10_KS36]|uniref:hypothetical protein n=1 Tax=Caballeronia sp. AZ10_KS36 TaxID=2921757 RepID=UPI00202965EF|nr:hypothetical protein [Caballeronia sp. AZ10_KS36]